MEVDPDAGSWTLTGPSGFGVQAGSGDQTFLNSPVGTYSVVFGFLPDYATPSPDTQGLVLGGKVTFTGIYRPMVDLSGNIYSCASAGSEAIMDASLTCNPGSSVLSSATGSYRFSNLVSGDPYIIDVTRETSEHDASFVTAFDASLVLQDTVGVINLDTCQVVAADVNQDSLVLAYDATLILRYTVGLIPQPFSWVFNPENRSYGAIPTSDLVNQDFEGVLKGDVSGNWTPSVAKSRTGFQTSEASLWVEVEEALPGKPIKLHVFLSEVEDLQAITNLTVEFDSSIFGLSGDDPVEVGSGLSGFLHVVNVDGESGLIRFSAAGLIPSKGGELLSISLNPYGARSRTLTLIRVSPHFMERSDGEPILLTGSVLELAVSGKPGPEEWDTNANGRLDAADLILLMRGAKADASDSFSNDLMLFARYWMQ